MELASNVARRDTFNRKGRNSFVPYAFEQYSKYCDKLIPQFCTWYAYEQAPLYEYLEGHFWSIGGYHQSKPDLYFDFIPFDFDSDTLETSLENTSKFVGWLKDKGIQESHFRVWLSGSKGFHVEVDRAAFDVGHPSKDVLRRIRSLVERLQKQLSIPDKELDKSLYSSGRLYRVPNSKHAKTGLHKTLIEPDNLNLEFLSRRNVWAANPGELYNDFTHEPLAEPIPLPDAEAEQKEVRLSKDITLDTSLSIISKCPRIQYIMANPQNRELRRQAAGVLMEAYGASDAAEVNALYDAFREHPYLDQVRYEDAEKWRKEFDKDGHIKCPKTCTSFGCSKEQKRICGTKLPSDHLITNEAIHPISVEEARRRLDEKLHEAIYAEGNDVHAIDVPIGLGKTTKLLEKIAADASLSVLCLCPTHDLARQVHEDATDLGIDSRHIMSRVRLYDNIEFECPYIDELRAMQGNSATNATRSVCSKCPRFPGNVTESSAATPCEYFLQYHEVDKVRLVVGVHAHANEYTYEKVKLDDRSFIAVDESPLRTFSGSIGKVPVELQVLMQTHNAAIRAELLEEVNNMFVEPPEVAAEQDAGLFAAVRALHAREEAQQAAEEFARQRISLEEAKAVQRFVYTCISAIVGGAEVSEGDLSIMTQVGYHQYYRKFLEKVVEKTKWQPAMELKEGFRHVLFPDVVSNAIKCVLDLGQRYFMNEAYFFPTVLPDNKIIILDATADKMLYEKMIEATNSTPDPRPLHYFKLPYVDQTHAHITQITNSGYSKARIASGDNVMDSLLYVLRTIRTTHPDDSILCVSVMELEAEVAKGLNIETGHYGALRGKNEYENFEWEVVLGGYFVSNLAIVESLNRMGIYGVTDEILEACTIAVRNKHLARDGSSYFSQRKTYRTQHPKDMMAYANALFEQASVSEIVQSIRVRLFSGKPDKNVVILTNIGLTTVYADRFLTLQELTAEMEDDSGLKSELDTTITRRNDLMLAKLSRLSLGSEFALEDINSNEGVARRFLAPYQAVGTIERVATRTFKKLAEPGEGSPKARDNKATVHARLDQWFEGLQPRAEFTPSEVAEVAETTSIHYLKQWLKRKVEASTIVKLGAANSTKYRKIQSLTGLMSELV